MLKVLGILIAVLAASAYDFSMQDDYLFNDFTLLDNDVTLARHRRDADDVESKNKEQKECCKIYKVNPEYSAKLKDIMDRCYAQLKTNKTERITKTKDLHICFSECVSRAFNRIDENGKLNREGIIKSIHDSYADEKASSTAAGYVDECINEVKAAEENKNDGQCSKVSGNFNICVHKKIFINCPTDMYVDSEKCNNLRKYFLKDV